MAAWWEHSPTPHQSREVDLPQAERPLDQVFAGPTFDLSGHRGESVFWVLGTLNEYLGRGTSEGRGSWLEQFYCNESKFVPVFRAGLRRMLRDQELTDDVAESVEHGCLTTFSSDAVAGRIDRVYRNRRRTGGHMRRADGRRWTEIIVLQISDAVFDGRSRDDRLAYLAGAYARFGDGSMFRFSNAEHKAALVARLLVQVGATDVRHETTRHTIPNGNTVSFRASPSLMRTLKARPR